MQLLKSRDPVVAALKTYANLASTKSLVKHYLQQVNAQYHSQVQRIEAAAQAAVPSAQQRGSTASAGSAASKSSLSAMAKKSSAAGQMKGVVSLLSLQKTAAHSTK